MGGKGSDPPPVQIPQAPQPTSDAGTAEMMAMMMSFMNNMQQITQQQMPAMPTPIAVPEAVREPIIDWTEKNDQLKAQQKAAYTIDQAKKHGRGSTILTSPLLDEEDANVSSSILAGN